MSETEAVDTTHLILKRLTSIEESILRLDIALRLLTTRVARLETSNQLHHGVYK